MAKKTEKKTPRMDNNKPKLSEAEQLFWEKTKLENGIRNTEQRIMHINKRLTEIAQSRGE